MHMDAYQYAAVCFSQSSPERPARLVAASCSLLPLALLLQLRPAAVTRVLSVEGSDFIM